MRLTVAHRVLLRRYSRLTAYSVHANTAIEQGTFARNAKVRHSKAYARSIILKHRSVQGPLHTRYVMGFAASSNTTTKM